jgi:hypothetical protein
LHHGEEAVKAKYLAVLLPLLANCAPPRPSDEWLAGGWVYADLECQSGDGLIFSSNAEFSSAGEVGVWELRGSKVLMFPQEVIESGNSNGGEPADTYSITIKNPEQNSFTGQLDNGNEFQFRRCATQAQLNDWKREGINDANTNAGTDTWSVTDGGSESCPASEEKVVAAIANLSDSYGDVEADLSCKSVRSKAERIVCADDLLRKMDRLRTMSAAFEAERATGREIDHKDQSQFRSDFQSIFRSKCEDRSCLCAELIEDTLSHGFIDAYSE